jgi:DNA repair photolyase
LDLLRKVADRTDLRVSFSITTNREDVQRLYEPHCAPIDERLDTIRVLRDAGIRTFVTLAPFLPCDPEVLARLALDATKEDLIGDPLHLRAVKRHGATTRDAAYKICARHEFSAWLEPAFQAEIVERIERVAGMYGRRFGIGTEGFRWLAQ